jgi:hypothetical protein
MTDELVTVADGFWNVRGSFKIAGLLDVGTHTSLVRLRDGDFVLLDSYTLKGAVEQQVLALTDQGRAVRAILNLHPFHTVHLSACSARFPKARLYGTRRHKTRQPQLNWEPLFTEDAAFHALFADDFVFSVPRGVDFIPHNEQLHFASVLAFHKASRTLHVDDTLTWTPLPFVGGLKFHPTLRFTLQKRPGAAAEFRAWTEELIALSAGAEHLCTSHMRPLCPSEGLAARVRRAVEGVSALLDSHERRYG